SPEADRFREDEHWSIKAPLPPAAISMSWRCGDTGGRILVKAPGSLASLRNSQSQAKSHAGNGLDCRIGDAAFLRQPYRRKLGAMRFYLPSRGCARAMVILKLRWSARFGL